MNHFLAGIRVYAQTINDGIIRCTHDEKMGKGGGKGHAETDRPRFTLYPGHDSHGDNDGAEQGRGAGIGHEIGH